MADIELVIKIPEEIYKASQIIDVKYKDVVQIPLEVIANGAPMPDNVTNGEWVDQYNDENWHCSKCGAIVEKDEQINHNWYFCYHNEGGTHP